MRGPPRALVGLVWLVAVVTLAAGLAWPPTPVQGQAQASVRVDSVEVEGVVRLSADEVAGVAGLRAGTSVIWVDVQRAIKSLWATGMYDDVAVRVEETDGNNVFIIKVAERALTRLVRINGLESISESDVLAESGLEEGQPLSRNGLARATSYIREELRRQGVPFARIEEELAPVPGDDGRVDVLLNVTEGQRVTVARVAFSGNDYYSDDDLRGAMTTKSEGFLWFRGGDYDDLDFEADLLEALPQEYQKAGFLDFQVVGDTLIVDPETGKARIEVQVDEGQQYRLANFEVVGNNAFETDQIKGYYEDESGGILSALGFGDDGNDAEVGRVFDVVSFEQAAQQVNELYNNEGYLYAQLEPYWEKTGDSVGGYPTVNAGWRIQELNQAYVNRIIIAGNDFTYDRIIREKVFLLPGDVYSQARLLQSYQNIQSLGFFETPMPVPDIRPIESGDVDIIFNVKEKNTGSVNFGTAVGGGVGLSGFLGYDQPNLFGQAKAGSVRYDFGRYINSFTLSASDPALFQSTISGSLSLFNSTDRFFQFSTGRRRRAGFTTRFGVPFPGSLRTRVFLGYSLSRTSYELFRNVNDRSLFSLPPGTLSSFSVGVTRRTLNHPLFPTSGSEQTWTTELNGGPLGGAGDFIKHTGKAQWMIPVGQLGGDGATPGGVQFALGLTMQGGAVFGDASRFPFESFWLGGVQFGQPLRGYDETSITPRGYFAENNRSGIAQIDRLGNAFFSATAEYKAIINSNISISSYFDAGNLWASPGDLDTSRLFRGAGFGVQLVTPFGPIGIDYAYGFDKTEPGWQAHFKMGPTF